jgi:hypothetical protein
MPVASLVRFGTSFAPLAKVIPFRMPAAKVPTPTAPAPISYVTAMANWLISKKVEPLRMLTENWDGEGAPRPDDAAIARAERIVRWAMDHALDIEDVSPDVLGGVAVFLHGHFAPHRRAWVALMNDGGDCIVTSLRDAGRWRGPLDDDALTRVATFLIDDSDDETE